MHLIDTLWQARPALLRGPTLGLRVHADACFLYQ